MLSRRIALPLLALALAVALPGCGDDEGAVSTGSTVTTSAPTSAPTTSAAPTTSVDTTPESTAPATTGVPPTTEGPVGPDGCAEGTPLRGDVDGDGTDDTVVLVNDPAAYTSELRVCTGTATLTLDALGATEVETTDIDGDGAVEILYGGAAATARSLQVARVVDGTLVTVSADGGPLLLTDGYPDGTPPDGPRHAFGCGGEVDGTAVHLVVLRVTPINAAEFAFSFDAAGYLLDGGTATLAATESVTTASGTPGGTPEELVAYANEIVAENAPAC